jgi:hypothetical protein
MESMLWQMVPVSDLQFIHEKDHDLALIVFMHSRLWTIIPPATEDRNQIPLEADLEPSLNAPKGVTEIARNVERSIPFEHFA